MEEHSVGENVFNITDNDDYNNVIFQKARQILYKALAQFYCSNLEQRPKLPNRENILTNTTRTPWNMFMLYCAVVAVLISTHTQFKG